MIDIFITRGTLHSEGKQCEDYREKTAIDKSMREAAEEINCADNFISDF